MHEHESIRTYTHRYERWSDGRLGAAAVADHAFNDEDGMSCPSQMHSKYPHGAHSEVKKAVL